MFIVPAGGDEQSAKNHLARRRDRETAGLPDVYSIKGGLPVLSYCKVLATCAHIHPLCCTKIYPAHRRTLAALFTGTDKDFFLHCKTNVRLLENEISLIFCVWFYPLWFILVALTKMQKDKLSVWLLNDLPCVHSDGLFLEFISFSSTFNHQEETILFCKAT